MQSFECQIQEKDVGDFFSVGGGAFVDVEGDRPQGKPVITFRRGGPLHRGWNKRIIRNPRSEKPTGQWYTVEIYVHGQTAVHRSEGRTNMVLTNLQHQTKEGRRPAVRGKIQIQSEGAEVFYRNIMIQPIDRIPDDVLRR
jgi:hypothetical protein